MNAVALPILGLLRVTRTTALVALAGLGTVQAQTSLVGNSPFAPSGAVGASALGAASAESYQLAGSTSEGSQVTVCIYTQQTKRSQWIPVGATVDGVHVISFDASHDTAVVQIGGSRKELAMRKASVSSAGQAQVLRGPAVAAAPVFQPAPIAAAEPPPPPGVPENEVREQREARMLVSDLLEIGVQQRKAYQEAKQRASSLPPPPPDN